MAIGDDLSIDNDGNIRWTGTTATHAAISLHRWLNLVAYGLSATGDDLLDMTSDDPSERAFDGLITLLGTVNIDDEVARHLYGGRIVQDSGNTIYDAITVYAPAGTYVQVVQNGAILSPNFWGTGLNADASRGVSHQFLVKTRSGGVDIDGRRLLGQCRTWGYSYAEFLINGTAPGENVIALAPATDLNNQTAIATVDGWTTISNVEGYRSIDVNDDNVDEHYYSEWNRASRSINDLFERAKYLSRAATAAAPCTDTGSNFAVGNGTILAQSQSFQNGATPQYLVRVRARVRVVGSPTGNVTCSIHAHSGTYGTSSVPTGAALATSANLAVGDLTTSYQEVEFSFTTPYEMAASTNYTIAINYSGGDGSNYVQVEGLASSGTATGNRAQLVSSTWTATAGDDLWFSALASPKLYGLPGELFRGITHELDLTTPRSGTFAAMERVTWPTGTGQMLAINSTTAATKMWIQLLSGTVPATGTLITGASTATATTTGAATDRAVSKPFVGASTGSAIIGAYGLGIEAADLSALDKVFDLTNTQMTPPNNVTATIYGLIASGDPDHVLACPSDGSGNIDFDHLTLQTTLNGAGVTQVVCTTSIPSDTPATGYLRISLDSGVNRRVEYTAWTGATFTIPTTDFSGGNAATSGNHLFPCGVDGAATGTTASYSLVYAAPRVDFVRVRNGGASPIKPFRSTIAIGSSGGSVTAIRTSDV